MQTKEAKARIAVRRRETLHGNGSSTAALSVHCPLRDESVDISECETCSRCEEIDLAVGGASVTCRLPERLHCKLMEQLRRRALPSIADRTPIATVMSSDVLCVLATVKLETLKTLLLARNISGAPVVDELGWPIGVISKTDLLRAPDGDETVENVMMPIAYTLRDCDSIARAAALMTVEGVHRLPVVASDGRVVGILSSLDLARWLAFEAGYID